MKVWTLWILHTYRLQPHQMSLIDTTWHGWWIQCHIVDGHDINGCDVVEGSNMRMKICVGGLCLYHIKIVIQIIKKIYGHKCVNK